MQSQLTVRLPENLEKEMGDISRKLHLKRSDIVRMALERFLQECRIEGGGQPYDKVKDLLGSYSSGIPNLGEAHREHLLRRLRRHA